MTSALRITGCSSVAITPLSTRTHILGRTPSSWCSTSTRTLTTCSACVPEERDGLNGAHGASHRLAIPHSHPTVQTQQNLPLQTFTNIILSGTYIKFAKCSRRFFPFIYAIEILIGLFMSFGQHIMLERCFKGYLIEYMVLSQQVQLYGAPVH